MDLKELETRFTYHAPKPGQPELYVSLRAMALSLAAHINDVCPDCRETSLALTHLEQTVMWANAGIARRG